MFPTMMWQGWHMFRALKHTKDLFLEKDFYCSISFGNVYTGYTYWCWCSSIFFSLIELHLRLYTFGIWGRRLWQNGKLFENNLKRIAVILYNVHNEYPWDNFVPEVCGLSPQLSIIVRWTNTKREKQTFFLQS